MSDLAARCHNRWPEIFSALGFAFNDALLRHKNVPCPVCGGGRDRFQFTDKGWGRWYCRGCQEGGDGIRLVERMLGTDFHEAAKRIEAVIGSGYKPDPTPQVIIFPRKAEVPVSDADKPLQLWREAIPSIRSTAVERYQATRGHILTTSEASVLRLLVRAWHWPSGTQWPTQVALVAMHDGTELCAHLTFLQRDGRGKAPVERPRLFPYAARPLGGGVWFGTVNPKREIAVAEGIESALSGMRLFGLEAGVAALSTSGIHSLILPPEAKRVRIFADHDAAGQGVAAACAARRCWQDEGRTVAIIHAREVGQDANDILRKRVGL
jgi:putative DNA primase/helicase